MEKTVYVQPLIRVRIVDMDFLLEGSVEGLTGDETIGYGGVDEDGSLDPGAKGFDADLWPTSVWAED